MGRARVSTRSVWDATFDTSANGEITVGAVISHGWCDSVEGLFRKRGGTTDQRWRRGQESPDDFRRDRLRNWAKAVTFYCAAAASLCIVARRISGVACALPRTQDTMPSGRRCSRKYPFVLRRGHGSRDEWASGGRGGESQSRKVPRPRRQEPAGGLGEIIGDRGADLGDSEAPCQRATAFPGYVWDRIRLPCCQLPACPVAVIPACSSHPS